MTQFNLPTHSHTLANQIQETINARDLHERLGVGRMFAHWIKERIDTYSFIEGEDYCLPNPASGTTQGLQRFFGGHNRKDYFLSLNMAKELAMLENNPKGRAIRRALINMERQLREDVPALIRKLEKGLAASQQELLKARPDWVKIDNYRNLDLSQADIAKLVELSPSALRSHLKRMNACQLLDYQPSRRFQKMGKLGYQAQQLSLLAGGEA